MGLNALYDELNAKLATVQGLRVTEAEADEIATPGAFISLPEDIDRESGTYGSQETPYGTSPLVFEILVLVSRLTERIGNRTARAYAETFGPQSIVAAVESTGTNTYASCTDVTITHIGFRPVQSGGVDYLGVVFRTEVEGLK